jgi:hypothetical protein
MISPLVGTARVAVVALAAGALLGLTACGDGGDAATVTTIAIRPESYALKPPATPPSTAPVVPTPDAEGRSQAEQSYTIHEDEYPFEIAALFDVELEALRNFNSWDAAHPTGRQVRRPCRHDDHGGRHHRRRRGHG